MEIIRILCGFFSSQLLAVHMPLLSSPARFTLDFTVNIMFSISSTVEQRLSLQHGA